MENISRIGYKFQLGQGGEFGKFPGDWEINEELHKKNGKIRKAQRIYRN